MAAMNEPREDLDLRRYSEILGREIAQMQEELERLSGHRAQKRPGAAAD